MSEQMTLTTEKKTMHLLMSAALRGLKAEPRMKWSDEDMELAEKACTDMMLYIEAVSNRSR